MFETTVTAVGRLITAVDKRYLPDGTSVASFRIACTERRFDRASGWGDGDTLFVGVTCWRRLADHVHSSLASGDPIIVRGRIYTRGWENKEGRRMSVIEMEADAIGPDLNRSTAVVTRLRRSVDSGPENVSEGGSGAGAAATREADPTGVVDLAGQDAPAVQAVPGAGR